MINTYNLRLKRYAHFSYSRLFHRPVRQCQPFSEDNLSEKLLKWWMQPLINGSADLIKDTPNHSSAGRRNASWWRASRIRTAGVPAKDTYTTFYAPSTLSFVDLYSFPVFKELPLFSSWALFISSFTAVCLTDMTAWCWTEDLFKFTGVTFTKGEAGPAQHSHCPLGTAW